MRPAPLTRRTLVRGAGAALGASALAGATSAALGVASPPTAAGGAVEPDAALFALLDRFGPLLDESDAADAVETELWDRFERQEPPRPDALRVRFGDDFPGGVKELCPDGCWRWFYEAAAIDDLREAPEPTRREWQGEPAPWDPDEEVGRWLSVPDPRRIARRAEILAAHDRWWAECRAIKARLGVFAAGEAAGDAADRLDELTVAILGTAPRTLAGLARKARWASQPGIPASAAATWSARIVADVVALAERGEGAT